MKDYYGRNEKSAAGENFRNRDYFYTKNSAKMQKNWPTENSPPRWGEELSAIVGCIYFFHFSVIFGAKIVLNWKISNHNAFLFFTIEIR